MINEFRVSHEHTHTQVQWSLVTPIDHAHCKQMGVGALSFHAHFALRGNSSMTEWSTKQCLFCYCMLCACSGIPPVLTYR